VIMAANDGERKAVLAPVAMTQTAAEGRAVNDFPAIAVTNLLNNSLKGPRLNLPPAL
jgi:hypothetical protein